MRKIALQGSTGSIGLSALEVVRSCPEKFQIVSLMAGKNVDLLAEQVREFKPAVVSLEGEEEAERLKSLVGPGPWEILWGEEGILAGTLHDEVDTVLAGASGVSCLRANLEAVKRGKRVGIANKELLVAAGELFVSEAKKSGALLIPVDSEHSAIFQALAGHDRGGVRRIVLTASGGPFHGRDVDFSSVTVEDALSHPVWKMGKKITVDSATMMNKGYELIEASRLFEVSPERVDVLIHPQSIVHSMVEFVDGSLIAHLGVPDMKIPIAFALSFPERVELCRTLSLPEDLNGLEFSLPRYDKFPSVPLAREVAMKGGLLPSVLVGANDRLVEHFLEGRVAFSDIYSLTERAVREMEGKASQPVTLEGVEETISEAVSLIDRIVSGMERSRRV
ncbi:MAG: 1-deoxy-D-xylulose-5-phosphate reductoisomerase [Deltaproteobacteria bacterium]|nr:MAG: 1-deoxy-D-xylulose-5-phosphate reductoisomerase [Deltaproteobacteria bacterium]